MGVRTRVAMVIGLAGVLGGSPLAGQDASAAGAGAFDEVAVRTASGPPPQGAGFERDVEKAKIDGSGYQLRHYTYRDAVMRVDDLRNQTSMIASCDRRQVIALDHRKKTARLEKLNVNAMAYALGTMRVTPPANSPRFGTMRLSSQAGGTTATIRSEIAGPLVTPGLGASTWEYSYDAEIATPACPYVGADELLLGLASASATFHMLEAEGVAFTVTYGGTQGDLRRTPFTKLIAVVAFPPVGSILVERGNVSTEMPSAALFEIPPDYTTTSTSAKE